MTGILGNKYESQSNEEPVIPEVKEAYQFLAKYDRFKPLSSEDKKRVTELLNKVPKDSVHYDKLRIVFSALNVASSLGGNTRNAADALKRYMVACGVKISVIHTLVLKARGVQGYEDMGTKRYGPKGLG